ncbi:MAG: hypothetical protein ACK5C9_06705 [Pseudanabaena sp.]
MMEEDTALENMKKTAFHEAGHVFLHEVFKVPYTSVQINENVNENAQKGVVHGDGEAPIDDLIYACICFSGAVSQDKCTHPLCPPEQYGESLQEGLWVNGSDLDKYTKLGLSKNHFRSLLDFTIKIIIDNDNWELVSKIADALIKKKQLRPEEVKQIVGDLGLKEKQYLYTLDLLGNKLKKSCDDLDWVTVSTIFNQKP